MGASELLKENPLAASRTKETFHADSEQLDACSNKRKRGTKFLRFAPQEDGGGRFLAATCLSEPRDSERVRCSIVPPDVIAAAEPPARDHAAFSVERRCRRSRPSNLCLPLRGMRSMSLTSF